MKKNRRFRNFLNRLSPIIFPVLWPLVLLRKFSQIRTNNKRKVLFVAQNAIAADYAKDISKLLIHDVNIRQFVTIDWFPQRDFTSKDLQNYFKIPFTHIFKALIAYWDLVIFVNHPFGCGIWFAPFITKIYVNHGIHVGKINNDMQEDGVYGKSRVIRPFSTPYYTLMFSSSTLEKQLAIDITPELKNRITVTGFLRADLFIAKAKKSKQKSRERFGFKTDDRVIHIISTWGPNSLYQTLGEDLLAEAMLLSNNYKFILSLHPRFDEFSETPQMNRKKILDKYEKYGITVNSDLDWEDFVISSDVAVTDHSSLSFYHILLDHPLILVDVPKREYIENSSYEYIKYQYPKLHKVKELGTILETIFNDQASFTSSCIKNQILEYQGQADKRYREEINTLLKL